jgi:predicted metal-dependent HD superfamily phosphohydrolase
MAEDRPEIRACCRLHGASEISKVNAPTPDRWAKLWRQVAATADAQLIHRELVSLYSQPNRHYHNLRHISECLAEFDTVRHLVHQPVAVQLAIWFHDAVYDTRARDNEEKSAQLAKRHLAEAGGSADLCNSVAALVLATKTHDPSRHPDAPLLVDADLSILGKPEERFQEYEVQIRFEYDWVPDQIFAEKRAEILGRFMARERIYSSDEFFARYERTARTNLQNSIRKLSRDFQTR